MAKGGGGGSVPIPSSFGGNNGYVHVLMRDEKEGRKKASKVKQTNKAKQHSTPKAATYPENELSRVGLEPTTLHTLDRALYHMYMPCSLLS